MDDEDWISIAETARRIGTTSSAVWDLVGDGKLGAEEFGRAWRIRATEVRRFLDEGGGDGLSHV